MRLHREQHRRGAGGETVAAALAFEEHYRAEEE